MRYLSRCAFVCGAADPDYTTPAPELLGDNGNSSPSTIVNYPIVIPFGYEVKTSGQIADEISSYSTKKTQSSVRES